MSSPAFRLFSRDDVQNLGSYSLLYASRGANVVVNDVSREAAQKVVDEIAKSQSGCYANSMDSIYGTAGGKAIANSSSVADGASVIKTAVDNFGTVTILINNAGILRYESIQSVL